MKPLREIKKRFSFINSWKSHSKQWDKVAVKIRIGRITVFDFYSDRSKKLWGLMILNFGIRKNKQHGSI